MNRDKMIEALAKRMAFSARDRSDVSEDSTEHWAYTGDAGKAKWIKVAAAVLDLCGPEPLDWDGYSSGPYLVTVSGSGMMDLHCFTSLDEDGLPECIMVGLMPQINVNILEDAAQAHATAAHWANTPLGKLVGVV